VRPRLREVYGEIVRAHKAMTNSLVKEARYQATRPERDPRDASLLTRLVDRIEHLEAKTAAYAQSESPYCLGYGGINVRVRHYCRHERAYPDGWFISTGVTPLGVPYAHAVHGSVVRHSFRWLFVRHRAAAWILDQQKKWHRIRYHGHAWSEVSSATDASTPATEPPQRRAATRAGLHLGDGVSLLFDEPTATEESTS
jgi:hypothetical protein